MSEEKITPVYLCGEREDNFRRDVREVLEARGLLSFKRVIGLFNKNMKGTSGRISDYFNDFDYAFDVAGEVASELGCKETKRGYVLGMRMVG